MKIAIDCRMFGMSGIGLFLKNFLDYALPHYPDIHFLLLGDYRLEIYSHLDNVIVRNIDILPFSMKEYLSFPVKEINDCDVYFNPNYNIPSGINIPICCTIHDLLFWDVKEVSSLIGRWIRILAVKRAYHLAKLIFTVSDFSLSRIHKRLGYKRAVITYNALRPMTRYEYTFTSDKKYIVFVGNVKPHKGLKDLLTAYTTFGLHTNYDLVIVGDYQNLKTACPELLKYKKVNGVSFTGKVSDEKLLTLIGSAAMLVQPSVYEGFGIPPMEALFLGVPVVLSDIPVFKEIYSDFPVMFFECENPQNLAEAICRIIPYTEEEKKYIRNKILSKYSQKAVSEPIIQAIIEIYNESSTNR
ncbi:glycosyltransferase family 4 protein [Bacteroides stercoris]|jgi:glycosyltransferase, family 1|uniref:glycosyltransferase family 4 protein n=1 Tax=Bacteroides stercoris TaxID=46506 RepID=UPI001C2DE4AE|nr:glycosyltransferase family 1 protein [Bacteroides stercoris]MBV1680230.1 glycosyltransferase family 4 protein [Bacteroides stercoris]